MSFFPIFDLRPAIYCLVQLIMEPVELARVTCALAGSERSGERSALPASTEAGFQPRAAGLCPKCMLHVGKGLRSKTYCCNLVSQLAITKWSQNTDEFGEGLGGAEHGSVIGNRGLSFSAGGGSVPSPFLSIVPATMPSLPFPEIPGAPLPLISWEGS